MIVLETSALIAVLIGEPGAEPLERTLSREPCILPVHCMLEAAIAWRRRGYEDGIFFGYVRRLKPRLFPFDGRQAAIAVKADRRFGRGSGHPARLNFGDCMSYAAAVALDAPLLFKGDDFAQTDVRRFTPA